MNTNVARLSENSSSEDPGKENVQHAIHTDSKTLAGFSLETGFVDGIGKGHASRRFDFAPISTLCCAFWLKRPLLQLAFVTASIAMIITLYAFEHPYAAWSAILWFLAWTGIFTIAVAHTDRMLLKNVLTCFEFWFLEGHAAVFAIMSIWQRTHEMPGGSEHTILANILNNAGIVLGLTITFITDAMPLMPRSNKTVLILGLLALCLTSFVRWHVFVGDLQAQAVCSPLWCTTTQQLRASSLFTITLFLAKNLVLSCISRDTLVLLASFIHCSSDDKGKRCNKVVPIDHKEMEHDEIGQAEPPKKVEANHGDEHNNNNLGIADISDMNNNTILIVQTEKCDEGTAEYITGDTTQEGSNSFNYIRGDASYLCGDMHTTSLHSTDSTKSTSANNRSGTLPPLASAYFTLFTAFAHDFGGTKKDFIFVPLVPRLSTFWFAHKRSALISVALGGLFFVVMAYFGHPYN
eukprot:Colp12_sorted_trinity150504_noHs@31676